ncbi:hypothetical protein [Rubritalea tangerina]
MPSVIHYQNKVGHSNWGGPFCLLLGRRLFSGGGARFTAIMSGTNG